jgi:hypothetical protein
MGYGTQKLRRLLGISIRPSTLLSERGQLFLDGFIMVSLNCGYSLSIRLCLNFVVEILLVLIYDLGLTDQTERLPFLCDVGGWT